MLCFIIFGIILVYYFLKFWCVIILCWILNKKINKILINNFLIRELFKFKFSVFGIIKLFIKLMVYRKVINDIK